jgi:hypothetical protein
MTHRWSWNWNWNCSVRSRAQCSQNHLTMGVRAFDLPQRTFVFHRRGLWRFVGAGSELDWDRSREPGGSRRGSVCFGAVARDAGNGSAGSGVVHDPVRRVQ